ncbi:hypothetical protein D3C77_637810 [compost metagenome]
MRIGERPVRVEIPAMHRRHQHHMGQLLPGRFDIAQQMLLIGRKWIGSPRIGLLVVMTELDHQEIPRLDLLQDRLQAAFLDKAPRAAPGLRMVIHADIVPEQGREQLTPSRVRIAVLRLIRHGGIARKE